MPGAPRTIININFNNVNDGFQRVKLMCEEFPTTKAKVKRFVILMNDYLKDEAFKDQETQTVTLVNDVATQTVQMGAVQKVLCLLKHLEADHRIFILETIWLNMSEEERVSTIFKLYNDAALEFSIEGQIRFLNLLGETFSEHLLDIFKQHKYKNGTTMEDLANINIQDYYEIFDMRLRALVEGCCKKKGEVQTT